MEAFVDCVHKKRKPLSQLPLSNRKQNPFIFIALVLTEQVSILQYISFGYKTLFLFQALPDNCHWAVRLNQVVESR